MLKSIYKFQKGHFLKNCWVLNVQSEHNVHVDEGKVVKSCKYEKGRINEEKLNSEEQKNREDGRANFKKGFNFDEFRTRNSNFFFFEAVGLGTAILAGIRFKIDSDRFKHRPYQQPFINHCHGNSWCPAVYLRDTTIYFVNTGINLLHPNSLGEAYCLYKLFKSPPYLNCSRGTSEDLKSLPICAFSQTSDNHSELDHYARRSHLSDEDAFKTSVDELENIYKNEAGNAFLFQKSLPFDFTNIDLLPFEKQSPPPVTIPTTTHHSVCKPFHLDSPSTQPSNNYILHNTSSNTQHYTKHMQDTPPHESLTNATNHHHQSPKSTTKATKKQPQKAHEPSSQQDISTRIFNKLYKIKQHLHNDNLNHYATQLASRGEYVGAVDAWKRVVFDDDTHQQALYNLALCYEKGLGVARDVHKALSLYRQSAELGNDKALQKVTSIQRKNSLNSTPPSPSFSIAPSSPLHHSSLSSSTSFSSLFSSPSSSFSSLSSSSPSSPSSTFSSLSSSPISPPPYSLTTTSHLTMTQGF